MNDGNGSIHVVDGVPPLTLITAPLMILTRGFRVGGKATAAH